MKAEFDITMTRKSMYRFLLYHAYHSFSGLFSVMAGIALFIAYFMIKGRGQNSWLYLAVVLFFLCYLPWSLYLQAARQVTTNPSFQKPLHYLADEEGISVSQGEASGSASWNMITKAVETRDAILLYTTKKNSFILIKNQLGSEEGALRELLSAHVSSSLLHLK